MGMLLLVLMSVLVPHTVTMLMEVGMGYTFHRVGSKYSSLPFAEDGAIFVSFCTILRG